MLRSEMHAPAVRPPLTHWRHAPAHPSPSSSGEPNRRTSGCISPYLPTSPRQAHEWVQDGCYVVLMPKAAIKRSGLTPVTDPATELIQAATPPCNPSQPTLQP